MSERYGTIGEMPEMLASLEEFLDEKIEQIEETMRNSAALSAPLIDVGRMSAYRDVLDFIIANPGG